MKSKEMGRLVFIFLLLFNASAFAESFSDPTAATVPTLKMTGEAELNTQYIRYGLSQSDGAPSFRGAFWFNFGPQFRLGMKGGNVAYNNDSALFLLQLVADLKITFNEKSSVVISYDNNKFYKSSDRNGTNLKLQMMWDEYRFSYGSDSNWEGTYTRNTRYGFGSVIKFSAFEWENEAGYVQTKDPAYSSYFDLKTQIGAPVANFYMGGAISATSSPGQFNGRGAPSVVVFAKTTF